jgi:hypothetical protein
VRRFIRDHLSTVSESLVALTEHLQKTFPDCMAEIDAVRQSHAPFRPQDIAAEF